MTSLAAIIGRFARLYLIAEGVTTLRILHGTALIDMPNPAVRISVDWDEYIPYSKDNPYEEGGMITSKLTSKAQTTIPQPIRAALRLKEGDELAYEIRGEQVVLTKARQVSPSDDPFRAFGEWDSAADRKAYGDL
jgi:antitoxin PrlF